jgi:hypothetical protein
MTTIDKYRCRQCGTFWRLNSDGTWSLYDGNQKPGRCCDNSEDFLSKVFPVAEPIVPWGPK